MLRQYRFNLLSYIIGLDFLYHGIPHASGLAFTVNGIDPKKLKLFCLSYIWRASITSWTEFSLVKLGEFHEEKIRKMLLADDCGSPKDSSVLFSKYYINYLIYAASVIPKQQNIGTVF